ncbi:diacylglycerol/lipid kinase family protein [Flaviflexus sp.]|uniref:diacylglycerol/lipid kinase family protein n=1 Tax=Flaviflexus sp. TaxID=1969482 RepID=UPI003F92FCF4
MSWEAWVGIAALLVALAALFTSVKNRQLIAGLTARRGPATRSESDQSTEDKSGTPVAVVFNPSKNIDLPALKRLVTERAAETGYGEVRWIETTVEDPGLGQAKQAVADGAGLVIAAGGDGTVRMVAEGLAGTGVPLAVIALGTGNLLARNMDLPISSTRDMVNLAFTGSSHAVDMGYIEADPLSEAEKVEAMAADPDAASVPSGEYGFAVIAGLGFDAAMVGDADSDLKSRIGWVAYVASAVKNMKAQKIHAGVTAGDAEPVEIDARSIMFANCGKLPGGVVLAPDAHLDDGWLELVIIDTKGGLVGWADLVRRMGLAGIGVTNDGLPSTGRIEMRKTRHASVVTDSPARVQVDGDVLGYATTVRSRVVPGGLLVRF